MKVDGLNQHVSVTVSLDIFSLRIHASYGAKIRLPGTFCWIQILERRSGYKIIKQKVP